MVARSIRHAVVTGASSGIGRAIGARLAMDGTMVTALGRDLGRLGELAATFEPGIVRPIPVELRDLEDVDRVGRELADDLPELDLLVHAAGAYVRGSVADADQVDFEEVLAVNLRAPAQLTPWLLPALERAAGQIAFLNSTAIMRPSTQVGAYVASKAGLRAYADGLRAEVNARGVRVISLYVGRTNTPLQVRIHELEGRELDPSRLMAADDVAEVLVSALHAPPAVEVTDLTVRPMRPPADGPA